MDVFGGGAPFCEPQDPPTALKLGFPVYKGRLDNRQLLESGARSGREQWFYLMTISIVTGAGALECSAPLSDQMPRGRFPPNFFLIPSVAPEGIILPPVLMGEGHELRRGQRAFLAPRVSEVRA